MSQGSHHAGRVSLFGLFARRAARRQVLRTPRLRSAESLERRQMLAADVDLDGVLLITGSEKTDKIFISAGSTPGSVTVRGVPGVAKNAMFTGVNAIVVNSLGGNDDIRIGSNVRDTSGNLLGVTVNAGNGNDRVEGGDGDDDLNGGIGNDNLRGRGGDDTIAGGAGNDNCSGEAGDDDIFGDSGRDTIRGGDDDDSLSGGSDRDTLFGDRGDDSLDGDEGPDKLYGGLGNDDDSPPGGSMVVFTNNAAQVTGVSANNLDRQYFLFTAPTSGALTVALLPGTGGRYADLELDEVATSADLLELEPREGSTASGTASVTAGRQYRMRLRSPDLSPVEYTVNLTIAPLG